MHLKKLLTFFLVLICASVKAQDTNSVYNQYNLFTPNFYPSSVNEYHAANWQPGTKY